jgi:hypothetical protein
MGLIDSLRFVFLEKQPKSPDQMISEELRNRGLYVSARCVEIYEQRKQMKLGKESYNF